MYPEDFKNHCTGVKHLSPSCSLLSRYIVINKLPVPACFKRLLEGKGNFYISAFQKNQNWSFGSTFQELFKFKSGNLFWDTL